MFGQERGHSSACASGGIVPEETEPTQGERVPLFFPRNAAAAASGLLRCQCQATAAPAALNAWLLRVTAATEHPCAGVPALPGGQVPSVWP